MTRTLQLLGLTRETVMAALGTPEYVPTAPPAVKVPEPPIDAATIRKARAMRRHGLDVRFIAQQLGISTGFVCKHTKKPTFK